MTRNNSHGVSNHLAVIMHLIYCSDFLQQYPIKLCIQDIVQWEKAFEKEFLTSSKDIIIHER